MTCDSCAEELPRAARFCPGCGARCGQRSEVVYVDERKVVSVVFCDVVGSTELSEQLDPEALRAVVLRYFASMTACIEAHGGRVEKFIGDAVMAVFGVPVVREDDARRALAAALDMLAALADLNAEIREGLGIRLDVRIGVDTGEVVTTGDATARLALVSGEVVNTAARLEQAAGPGEILIGPEARRAAGAVEVTDAGWLALHGKAERVHAYRLRGLPDDEAEFERRSAETPFVGRQSELAALDRVLGQIGETGARIVRVLGEAGIGKTRLIQEWAERAGRSPGLMWGRGRCRPYGNDGSLAPLSSALRQVLAALDREPAPGALALLEAGLLRDGTPSPSTQDTCAALVDVLTTACSTAPVVLLLDDFHWAGPILTDVLERTLAGLAVQPIIVFCLTRPTAQVWACWDGPASTTIELSGLCADECARLAEELADVSAHEARAPAAMTHASDTTDVFHRTGGNPLFLEQLLAMMAEGRRADELPITVQALLGARIDALDPADRAVLSTAAVIGRDFHENMLRELSEQTTARAALQKLVQFGFIAPEKGRCAQYRFRSGLVHDVAYHGTTKRMRAERHERIADALASRGATDAVVGTHLATAYGYHGELGLTGPSTERLRQRSVRLLATAGAQAMARTDLAWAAELLERAETLARRGEPTWFLIAWRLAEIHLVNGRLAEGRSLLQEAAASEDPGIAAHARLSLSALDPGTARGVAADTAADVLPLFEAAGDDLGIARACLRLAQRSQWNGDHGQAEALLVRALKHATAANAEPERAAGLGAIGLSLWLGPTPVSEALERCRALLAQHGGDRRVVQIALYCPLALLLAAQDEPAAARMRLDEAERLSAGLGYAEAAVFLPVFRAEVENLADRPDRAAALLLRAERECRALGATGMIPGLNRELGRVLLAAGDPVGAAQRIAHSDSAELLPRADSADLYGILARLSLAVPEDARALADRAVEQAEQTDSPVIRATAALDRARTALALGLHEEAAAGALAALRGFTAKGHRPGMRWASDLARRCSADGAVR
jgi:class 3 adenylate cyclase/RecA/RadA recombinase